jgi:hypothetical protein
VTLRPRLIRAAVLLLAGAAVVVAAKLLGMTGGFAFQTALVAGLAVAALELTGRRDLWRAAAYGILIACAALALKWMVPFFLDNWRTPHTWDFLAFYVDGSIGASGRNFYDPRSYQEIFPQLQTPVVPDVGFVEEVVDVGFKYPPVTMLLLAPLGHLDFHSAHLLWLTFVALTTIAATLAFSLLLPRETHLAARLLCAVAVVFALPATLSNAFFEQTNALLLALAAAACIAGPAGRAGAWSALAMCVKPVMAVMGLHLLCRRYWRAVVIAAACLLVAGLVTLAVFGPATTFDYLRANPIAHVPAWLYTDWINQSLLATLLRLFDPEGHARGAELLYPPFLIGAAVVGATSVYAAVRVTPKDADLSLGILLCAGLLLYPGTLMPYSTLLLVPVASFYVRRATVWRGHALLPIGIGLTYLLLAHVAFAANALVWGVAIVWALQLSRRAATA